ncbi:hypothetical protein E2C01_037327 [Portunus trituberculatus]|uniref:Uncharacterized protein n=1 Tax=Portunus trituberculatus TaxID=210409 RepID=A0A5B7FDV9_PORTR|nr:hypothetical protein [Portunus trituberculatus]
MVREQPCCRALLLQLSGRSCEAKAPLVARAPALLAATQTVRRQGHSQDDQVSIVFSLTPPQAKENSFDTDRDNDPGECLNTTPPTPRTWPGLGHGCRKLHAALVMFGLVKSISVAQQPTGCRHSYCRSGREGRERETKRHSAPAPSSRDFGRYELTGGRL